MGVLLSGRSGGRMRTGQSHDQPSPYIESDSKARAACPDKSHNEDIHFNQVAFDKYAELVLQFLLTLDTVDRARITIIVP